MSIPGGCSGHTRRTWQGAWSSANRVRGPRLLGPRRASPSRARISRSAPAQASSTSRSIFPRRATLRAGRPRRARASSSSAWASSSAIARKRRTRWRGRVATEQARAAVGSNLLDVDRGHVQERHLGVLGQERARLIDAGLPRVLGYPDDGAHHTTCRANHNATVHASRRCRHGEQPQARELAHVGLLVVGVHDPPPQKRGERPDVGQIRPHVDADEHREHGPRAARGGDRQDDQRRRQVVEEVGDRGADHGDQEQRRQRGAVGQDRVDRGREAVLARGTDHDAQPEHEYEEGRLRRAHDVLRVPGARAPP